MMVVKQMLNRHRLVIVAAMLALVTLACTCGGFSNVAELAGGALQGDDGEAGLAAEEAGAEPEAGAEAAQEGGADQPAESDAAGEPSDAGGSAPAESGESFVYKGMEEDEYDTLDSAVSITFEGTDEQGQPVSVKIEGTVQIQRDPLLMAMQYTTAEFEGVDSPGVNLVPGQGDNMTFYVTTDTAYMEFSGLCFAIPLEPGDVSSEDFQGMIIDPEEYLDPGANGEFELQFVGTETVNGLETAHYRATNVQLQDFDEATVDLWYSSAENRIVRMAMVGTGSGEFGTGTMEMTWDLLSVNEVVDITLPENCVEFDIPETTE
jgi:hypothetical protein